MFARIPQKQEKVCSKCENKKPFNEFYKHIGGLFDLCSTCKTCMNAYNKNYHKIHREKYRKRFRTIYSKTYREKNRKKIRTRSKTQHYRKQTNKRNKQRRQTDSKFRLTCIMSGAIRKTLKDKKGRRWESLVGYTVEKLIKHLEKQFTEDMSWNNYSLDGWVIDHKIPISVFNFTKPEHRDFKRCWALSNLQPMWARDNIIKSNRLNKHFQPSLLI